MRVLKIILVCLLLTLGIYSQTPDKRIVPSVPDINGRAVSLVKPAFPETAVAVDADGASIILRVVVDENGNVVSADCSLTCHEMLRDAAELAAMTSKFAPLMIDGRPVRYQGQLHYTFVVERVSWHRFGTALESTRQMDNLSLGPVAQILSPAFAAEKAKLLTLDADGVDFETRQKTITEVTGLIKSRLTGNDLWKFELAMALRRATFWLHTGRIDRVQMQKALDDLGPHIASAPEGTSKQFLTDLQTLAKFQIQSNVSDRDLSRLINEMSRKLSPVFNERR